MWQPSGTAIVCGESFRSCMRSIPVDDLVFGPERQSEPASARERQFLTEVARLTRSGRGDMTEVGELDLWTEGVMSVPADAGKKLLIGGQYLRVPGDTTLRVDLDLEVTGDRATIDFHQDVFLNGYEKFARKGIQVRDGERWRLSYEIGVPNDSSQLVVQLYATTISGEAAEIEFHDARLSMTAGRAKSRQVVVIVDEVAPADPR